MVRIWALKTPVCGAGTSICGSASKTYGPPRLQSDFCDLVWSVCDNVSGLWSVGLAKMEIRASRSS
jgi:hypothetical protein